MKKLYTKWERAARNSHGSAHAPIDDNGNNWSLVSETERGERIERARISDKKMRRMQHDEGQDEHHPEFTNWLANLAEGFGWKG